MPGMQPPTLTTTGFPDDSPDYNAELRLRRGVSEVAGSVMLWAGAVKVGEVEHSGFVVVQGSSDDPSFQSLLRENFSDQFEVRSEAPLDWDGSLPWLLRGIS